METTLSQSVRLVADVGGTNTRLALFDFDRARRRFVLRSVHPGHSADEVRSATGFDYDIDWDGEGTVDQIVSGPDGTTVYHTFTAGGSTTVIVTATDKDGLEGEPGQEITVVGP